MCADLIQVLSCGYSCRFIMARHVLVTIPGPAQDFERLLCRGSMKSFFLYKLLDASHARRQIDVVDGALLPVINV